MATKKQNNSKYEVEIDKLRNENKWDKLKDYVKNLSKDSKYETIVKLCLAEAELERYLFFNPLLNDIESNNRFIIDNNLNNVEKYLTDVINKSDNPKLTNDALILLSKFYYSQLNYDETLNTLNKIILLNKPQQQQIRNLRQTQLLAEAYSLKGLCLERLQMQLSSTNSNQLIRRATTSGSTPTTSSRSMLMNNSNSNKENYESEIIKCFEMASDLAVDHSQALTQLYQQQQEQQQQEQQQDQQQTQLQQQGTQFLSLQQIDEGFDLMNPLLEIALQKAPILYIKKGDINGGLNKFRDLLLKKHIQSIITIRQSLLKKFGESLLTSVCLSNYIPFISLVKSDKIYKPNSLDEETLLCLSLSQYLASKEVMLLRQPQYKLTREKTFNNAITSLDLLIIYLTYRRTFPLLTEKFESTAKYSFEQFYVWYQYGLSLICAQKYQKGYSVMKECNRMKPEQLTCILLLAQLALEHLLLIDEGIEWSKQALELSDYNLKANIFYGCGLIKKALLEKQHNARLKYLQEALEKFQKAHEINPYDYLSLYHLSHCYALLRKITESIETVQKAIKLKPDDKDCLHLLCLLLTSTKNYEEAYTVILKACTLYDDFELIYTKSRIEEHLFGFNECMTSLITLIDVYKKRVRSLENVHYTLTNRTTSSVGYSGIDDAASSSIETASLANLQNTFKLNEAIGKTITMLLKTDTYITKQISQQTLNMNYELNNNNYKAIENLLQLIRILSEICEFYLRHDRLQDAELCCNEIGQLHSMSYIYMYLRGRIYLHKKDYINAKLCFNNALSINPTHINSLEQISICLFQLNELQLAEKMIRDAITINNSLPHLWYILGYILDASEDSSEAALKCYQTALQLESTNPIVQFSSLTKIL